MVISGESQDLLQLLGCMTAWGKDAETIRTVSPPPIGVESGAATPVPARVAFS